MPTGPARGRPDDRLRIEPGIQGFPDVQLHILGLVLTHHPGVTTTLCHRPRRRAIQYSREAGDCAEKPRRTGYPACAGYEGSLWSCVLICRHGKSNFCIRLRQINPTGKSLLIIRNRVKPPFAKIFRFAPDPNQFTDSHRLVPARGADRASSRNAASGCDGRLGGARDLFTRTNDAEADAEGVWS